MPTSAGLHDPPPMLVPEDWVPPGPLLGKSIPPAPVPVPAPEPAPAPADPASPSSPPQPSPAVTSSAAVRAIVAECRGSIGAPFCPPNGPYGNGPSQQTEA